MNSHALIQQQLLKLEPSPGNSTVSSDSSNNSLMLGLKISLPIVGGLALLGCLLWVKYRRHKNEGRLDLEMTTPLDGPPRITVSDKENRKQQQEYEAWLRRGL